MLRTLEVFEHSRIPVATAGDGLRPREFDALVRFNDRHRGRYFDVGHKVLRTTNFVGYLEVGDVAIEILPKADRGGTSHTWRDGLLEMLRIAMGLKLNQVPNAGQQ